jgi:hypothetical protein
MDRGEHYMRVFDHPNMVDFTCPICKTSDDKPVVLIGIVGTEEDNIMEARQYHLDCLALVECNTPDSDRYKYIIQTFKK